MHAPGTAQDVARRVPDGPWRPLKVQLCWVLFLLAARSPANRELLLKLERTVVAPLAAQVGVQC